MTQDIDLKIAPCIFTKKKTIFFQAVEKKYQIFKYLEPGRQNVIDKL